MYVCMYVCMYVYRHTQVSYCVTTYHHSMYIYFNEWRFNRVLVRLGLDTSACMYVCMYVMGIHQLTGSCWRRRFLVVCNRLIRVVLVRFHGVIAGGLQGVSIRI